jgi:Ca2+-binding RTX toxin-like protein
MFNRIITTAVAVTGTTLALGLGGSVHADDAPTRQERAASCRGQVATHVDEDGGPGDDVIIVTTPGIEVNGWNGRDLICVSTGHGYGARVDGGNGNDTIITYSGENVVLGGDDDDSILSNSADHVLDGEDGDDTIHLGAHHDHIVYGGAGNDRIFGTPFADTIDAGPDHDFVMAFAGDDAVHGAAGLDHLNGGDGSDDLDGGGDSDVCVDTPAPHTSFTSCESIVGLPLGGAGGLVGS